MLVQASQEAQVDTRYVSLQGDKWRPEEDAKLMELADRGRSWKDISRELPGRSERSCYKHYRNYILKELLDSQEAETIKELAQMWEPIAKEVALPWQRVESIYLQLQRERRITSEKTNGRSMAKSYEMLSRESATLPQRSPLSQSVVRETLR
ncbi:hypothetical protein K469DRAFT_648298 [Zopfia rhizophila CBS 207.26]|uniref:Uncharacterized protein n=1 Tax=Zopfia rhizophila CBS 207.26 TaxID=1314779 RepID=A0A6A6D8V9_9PEZI|nr:hypothetical protein K469DRAFT_648298 [Zopfia rhizophila CBS 207.26]